MQQGTWQAESGRADPHLSHACKSCTIRCLFMAPTCDEEKGDAAAMRFMYQSSVPARFLFHVMHVLMYSYSYVHGGVIIYFLIVGG